MCGICGTVALGDAAIDPGGVRAMLAGLVHRGPDSEGLLERPGLAAGIRRLAVVDPEGGTQPIANEDGSVAVVFNGEIYNHVALRAELEGRGHRFRTRADTEVLVHLWEDLGPGMLERLNGMFALCLHDRGRGETFLARDPSGIKPLLYAESAGRLTFASETAAVLRDPEVRPEIDEHALIDLFLLQYVPGDRTVFRGIRKLLPGHALSIRGGRVEPLRWHTPPPSSGPAEGSLRDAAETLRTRLADAVSLQLEADVPVGMFLSGGLDSAALLATAAARSSHPVRTFAVGFEEESHDERAFARKAAELFGARHHEIVFRADDLGAWLPRMVEHLGEPVGDPATIPTWLLSQFARREVTVALSGEGADELFAGYLRYRAQSRLGGLARLPGAGAALKAAARAPLPGRAGQALEALAETDPAANHLRWSSTVPWSLAARLFGVDAVERFLDRAVVRVREAVGDAPAGARAAMRADRAEWLPHGLLTKVDRASMAHSLEARVPYLDPGIVAWADTLPESWLIDGSRGKRVLREAFRSSLPAEILDRPKRGFDLPLAHWLRGPLRDTAGELFRPATLALWPGLDGGAAAEVLEEHISGRRDHGLPLFVMVSTLLFLRNRP